MAEDVQSSPVQKLEESVPQVVSQVPKLSAAVVEEFQKLTNHEQRKAFYRANPTLGLLYSETNFH